MSADHCFIEGRGKVVDVGHEEKSAAIFSESREQSGSPQGEGQVPVAGGIEGRLAVLALKHLSVWAEAHGDKLRERGGGRRFGGHLGGEAFDFGLRRKAGHQKHGYPASGALGCVLRVADLEIEKALAVGDLHRRFDHAAEPRGHAAGEHHAGHRARPDRFTTPLR